MLQRNRRQTDDEGAALVEFGLVMPLFLSIVLAVVTAGLAMFARLQVSTAAQEGARVLYLGGTASEARAAALAATTGNVEVLVGATPQPGSWSCAGNPGTTVTVRMRRDPMSIEFVPLSGLTDIAVQVVGRGVTRCA